MRKRLEIGTALFPSIKVFILDEPTTGVDPSGRRDFLGMLNDLRKEGITVLMTTHIGADAEAASRVGLMDKGRILAEGEPEELTNKIGLKNAINVETSIKSKKSLESYPASTRAKCRLKLKQDTESTQIRQRRLLLK